jgi:hypothetical protein
VIFSYNTPSEPDFLSMWGTADYPQKVDNFIFTATGSGEIGMEGSVDRCPGVE